MPTARRSSPPMGPPRPPRPGEPLADPRGQFARPLRISRSLSRCNRYLSSSRHDPRGGSHDFRNAYPGKEIRHRRWLTAEIRDSLRELGIQLALLNHHIVARLELKDVDLDCFNLIERHGPLSPSALARRAGLHPATMTGILDRLERGGWTARDRDPSDRRAPCSPAPYPPATAT